MIELYANLRVRHAESTIMLRSCLLSTMIWVPLLGISQTHDDGSPSPPLPSNALQGGWNRELNLANAVQWERANAQQPGRIEAQWNWFQSEYAASMGQNNGHLPPADREHLDAIAGTLRKSAPISFERHLADYYLAFPAPNAFAALRAAEQAAPDRTELLSPMLTMALLQHDPAAMRKWSLALATHGAIAPALMAAANDVLLCLPERAVLFTNGDMDTQPALIGLQHDPRHAGVWIVDRRLLVDATYRAWVWRNLGRSGPVPPDGPGFAKALGVAQGPKGPSATSANGKEDAPLPVYFSLGMDRSWLEALPGQLQAVGAVFRVGMPRAEDARALARNWADMAKPVQAGPMSRNYLVPGSLLLLQHRQAGRTSEAADVERDLRRLAVANGMERELRQMGLINP